MRPWTYDELLPFPGCFRFSVLFHPQEIEDGSRLTIAVIEPAREIVGRDLDLAVLFLDVGKIPVRTVVRMGKPLIIIRAEFFQKGEVPKRKVRKPLPLVFCPLDSGPFQGTPPFPQSLCVF